MGDASLARSELEEIFWSAFPEGHPPPRSPGDLATITEAFLKKHEESPDQLLRDPVAINHLAFLMAQPAERLDDEQIEVYCEVARFALRALAMAE